MPPDRSAILVLAKRLRFNDFPAGAFLRAAAAAYDVELLVDEPSASDERDLQAAGAGVNALPPTRGDEAGLLAAVEGVIRRRGLEAILFLGEEIVDEAFAAVRHLAGPDQSVVCLLPKIAAAGPSDAPALRRRNRRAELLGRADAVWTADAASRRALGGKITVDVLPRFSESPALLAGWLAERLAAVRGATSEKGRYGEKDLATIVVPAHNDGTYLKACLASLRKHTPGPHEVVVVDNGTTDGSTAFLDKQKGLRLIRNKKNLFFAAACNAGISAARGQYIVLLNADVVVTPRWLELIVRRMKRDATIGLAGPYTNSSAGAQRVAKPGYKSLKGLDAFAAKWTRAHEGGRLDVPRLDGFCLAIKREVVQSVGLLDERFGPGGYEDYDYCLRARQAGYRLVLAEEVYVHHHGGKGYRGDDYDAHRARNREIFIDKWTVRALQFLDETW